MHIHHVPYLKWLSHIHRVRRLVRFRWTLTLLTGHGRVLSLGGNQESPCPCLVVIKQNLVFKKGHSPSCVSSGRLAGRSGVSHARASVACLFLCSRLVAAVLFRLTPLITGAAYPSSWLAFCCDCVTPPFDAVRVRPSSNS